MCGGPQLETDLAVISRSLATSVGDATIRLCQDPGLCKGSPAGNPFAISDLLASAHRSHPPLHSRPRL